MCGQFGCTYGGILSATRAHLAECPFEVWYTSNSINPSPEPLVPVGCFFNEIHKGNLVDLSLTSL